MNMQFLRSIIFPNDEYSSQINFLAKELYPIYISFFLFSVIYSYQYVYYGLWKRIIYAVIVGICTSTNAFIISI